MTGTIVRGVGGFYYVDTENGIYECKGRGLFRKTGDILYVGDVVEISDINEAEKTAVVASYEQRKNLFIRPPVSNVDQFITVMALASPKPNIALLDRFLVMAEMHHTDIVVCFNKVDLSDEETIEKVRGIYGDVYPLVFVNGVTGQGLEDLRPYLAGKKSAFSGPSGVGKSTIINGLQAGLSLETGSISRKSGRGKHTTRHVELFKLDTGGMMFDTPGFTSFEILEADEEELAYCYPEFAAYLGECRFKGCRHLSEPDCAVKDGVKAGKISGSRYASYKQQIEEIREREKRKY